MRPTMNRWEVMDILNDSFFKCKENDKGYKKGWCDAIRVAENDISLAFGCKVKSKNDSKPKSDGSDPVNHPSHYTFSKYEVIDVLEEWDLPLHLANSVKYIARAGRKDPETLIQDIRKAIWYLNRYIEFTEKKGGAE